MSGPVARSSARNLLEPPPGPSKSEPEHNVGKNKMNRSKTLHLLMKEAELERARRLAAIERNLIEKEHELTLARLNAKGITCSLSSTNNRSHVPECLSAEHANKQDENALQLPLNRKEHVQTPERDLKCVVLNKKAARSDPQCETQSLSEVNSSSEQQLELQYEDLVVVESSDAPLELYGAQSVKCLTPQTFVDIDGYKYKRLQDLSKTGLCYDRAVPKLLTGQDNWHATFKEIRSAKCNKRVASLNSLNLAEHHLSNSFTDTVDFVGDTDQEIEHHLKIGSQSDELPTRPDTTSLYPLEATFIFSKRCGSRYKADRICRYKDVPPDLCETQTQTQTSSIFPDDGICQRAMNAPHHLAWPDVQVRRGALLRTTPAVNIVRPRILVNALRRALAGSMLRTLYVP